MTQSVEQQVDYSIVVPVYYNEGSLAKTFAMLREQVVNRQSNRSAEIIFVDDGSGDGSYRELTDIREQAPELVKLIKLTRNFGQVNALRAGMAHSRGRCVAAMSADGQDPAELMNEMLKAHFDEGYEVVICSRDGRDESFYRVATSRMFYALIRKICFPAMPLGGFDYVLLGRRALQTMLHSREAQPFFQGQILWMGFRMKVIPYRRKKREVGESRWTFGRKLTYLIDGVMNYSFLPIRMVSLAGLMVAFLGFIYAIVVLLAKVLFGNPVKGWVPLMIVVLVLGGFQMLTLGVFGEYVWRILAQAQQRDPYVIDEKQGFASD